MPSHFSTIGMPVVNEDDFVELANQIVDSSTAVGTTEFQYLRWNDNCGAEIWLQLNPANEIIGMVPHFDGHSKMRVGDTSRINRPGDTTHDGAFHGWADPSNDDPESGIYPFVFDSPDYARHTQLSIPTVVSVQMTAFAYEISVFDSMDAYDTVQSGEPKFASQSFIPSGMFSDVDESIDQPQSYGIFTGHVVQSASKRNGLTGHVFYWALVDSLGGSFDVVIDQELLKQEPKTGGVLQGSFWLSGKIVG